MAVWLRKCASFAEEAIADREYWQRYTPDERVAQIEDLLQEWKRIKGDEVEPGNRDFADLFEALNGHGVRALVVGAYAFAFYVKPRYTKDIDLFVDTASENVRRLLAAIGDFGFGALDLTAADFAPGRVVQLGTEPRRVDLITRIDGVTFEEAWATRVAGKYAGVDVFYIGREALIRNKTASGRPQDLADLAALRSCSPR